MTEVLETLGDASMDADLPEGALHRYGADLASLADGTPRANAASAVILEALARDEFKVIVLISDDTAVALSVLREVATRICRKTVDRELWGRRLVHIDLQPRRDAEPSPEPLRVLSELFEEAGKAKNVTLVISGGASLCFSGQSMVKTLRALLDDSSIKSIWLVTSDDYKRWEHDDATWKRSVCPIWIHEVSKEIPREL